MCRNLNLYYLLAIKKKNSLRLSMLNVSPAELNNLEALLLNTSGNVPLHSRFRALFTLKALKSDEAVIIISKGHLLNASTTAGDRHLCRISGSLCSPQT